MVAGSVSNTVGFWSNKRKSGNASGRLVQDRAEEQRRGFESLVTQDWQRFYRYALRLCGGRADDAEDLLSETLVDAFRAFDTYRGSGFDRWFFRMITTNRIDMARRAKIRRTESLDTAFTEIDGATKNREISADPAQTPERTVLDPLYSEWVQTALDALSEDFRAALLLADVEGLDYQEIATVLNIPVGTVRSRIHRARARMRELLAATKCCTR